MGRYRRLKRVPDEVVRRYRGKLGTKDIEYLYRVGVVSGRWDEGDMRVLDAFAKVWKRRSFLKRLLVRLPYRERVMVVETAAYGRLGSLVYSIVRRRLDEEGRVRVSEVVDEVIEKLGIDAGLGFRVYLERLVSRIQLHVYLMRPKRK